MLLLFDLQFKGVTSKSRKMVPGQIIKNHLAFGFVEVLFITELISNLISFFCNAQVTNVFQ